METVETLTSVAKKLYNADNYVAEHNYFVLKERWQGLVKGHSNEEIPELYKQFVNYCTATFKPKDAAAALPFVYTLFVGNNNIEFPDIDDKTTAEGKEGNNFGEITRLGFLVFDATDKPWESSENKTERAYADGFMHKDLVPEFVMAFDSFGYEMEIKADKPFSSWSSQAGEGQFYEKAAAGLDEVLMRITVAPKHKDDEDIVGSLRHILTKALNQIKTKSTKPAAKPAAVEETSDSESEAGFVTANTMAAPLPAPIPALGDDGEDWSDDEEPTLNPAYNQYGGFPQEETKYDVLPPNATQSAFKPVAFSSYAWVGAAPVRTANQYQQLPKKPWAIVVFANDERAKALAKARAYWAKHPKAEKTDKQKTAKMVHKASKYTPSKNDFPGVDTRPVGIKEGLVAVKPKAPGKPSKKSKSKK